MPSQDYESCIFEYFPFLSVILLYFWTVVWRAIAEYYDTLAIHEVGLYVILLWKHWLCLVWQAQVMVVKILQELIFCRAVVVSCGFQSSILLVVTKGLP